MNILQQLAVLIRNAINLRVKVSEKGVANGIATLDANAKVPESQLRAIAITDTFVVADEASMLALVAERGDVAVRTDVSKSYILKTEPATTHANWEELRTPASPVQSVAGKIGVVTLVAADITDLGSYTDFETEFNNGLL